MSHNLTGERRTEYDGCAMMTVYVLLLILLLLLNVFFVLAEFAAVKVRGSQISALEDKHPRESSRLAHIHNNLDEYLSVCQIGITLASIGLGFVGEPAVARALTPLLGNVQGAHALSITISYIVISILHIVIGEQVPKVYAISNAERVSLWLATPLRFFHWLLYVPLWLLNVTVRFTLRALRLPDRPEEASTSEAEVRVILEKSQQEGMMPFRRLLLLENVFDFGTVRVKDEMRPLAQIVALRADRPWEENRDRILNSNHTRFPLMSGEPPRPIGMIHIKDLLHAPTWPNETDLHALARKAFTTTPDTPLEQLLTDLRRRRIHMAIVQDAAGQMQGLITMEDILEQLVGAIEDEFEMESPIRLGDVLKENRIVLDLVSTTAETAIEEIIRRASVEESPVGRSVIIEAVKARERSLSTYLGEGLAVPHARLDALKAPLLFFAHSHTGVAFDPKKPDEKAHILFLLLTPTSVPRMQTRLLSRIANLRESAYVWDRLLEAGTSAEALEAIRSGDELLTT